MAKGKKSVWKIILIVVVVIGVIGAVGSGGKSDSKGSADAPAQEQKQEQEEPESEPYAITDETLDTSNQFSAYITGTLTNNTDRDLDYIQVEYVLYDADGAQIGTALANTNNLKAGGAWKFEAAAFEDGAEIASFELADVTGF
ncbi:FxLYD domain-containing protein [Collinsella provencensis]|uniref:FxLYD domain-containing protein n=1 Tax=Collinsella provencensis TaxID=1937461 RepID=UPI001F3A9F76|nr:FxLYD domain-containing protein [Collinsella provencensis]